MSERDDVTGAAAALAATVRAIEPDQWDQPGLGVWSVRELAAHASRGLSTIATYIDQPAPRAERADAAEYLVAALADPAIHEQVARRGVETAAALGPDVPAAIDAMATSVLARLAGVPDDLVINTAGGAMRLDDYLPTRTMELVVHTLDLQRATGVRVDIDPGAMRSVLGLLTELALRRGQGAEVIAALTGRAQLSQGYSVL